MAVNAGAVFVELGAKVDRRDFELYDAELKKVRERVAKREHFKVQLGGDYDARAFNAYERQLKQSQKATDEHVHATARLRTGMGSLWGHGGEAVAAIVGIEGLRRGVESVTKAYEEHQLAEKQLQTQVKASGASWDANREKIEETNKALSRQSGIAIPELDKGFTVLLRSTKSVTASTNLMQLTTDVARAKHVGLSQAALLVAKAHDGNVGALKRMGIAITPVTAAVDKLHASNSKATAQQVAAAKEQDKVATGIKVVGELQKRFGGQAEAYGKTQAGAMDRLKVSFEELRVEAGQKLAPALTRAALAMSKFIAQMSDGTGSGGKFVKFLEFVGNNVRLFVRNVKSDMDLIAGFFSSVISVMHDFAQAGSHLPVVGGQFKKVADATEESARKIDAWRKGLKISVEVGKVTDDLESMRKKTGSSIADMRKTTRDGMKLIRDRLGADTEEGRKALASHFQGMVRAIESSMHSGVISTRTGLAEIRRLLTKELENFGVSGVLKSEGAGSLSKSFSGTLSAPKPTGKAGGGWIGAPGQVGQDTVPAMLGVGEAVLNRHQQAVIEGILGDGFLDQLFANVQRPHYLATGGRAGLQPAVSSFANKLASQFGLSITSTTGGTHAPGSYHYQGLAADLGGPPAAMMRAAEWIKSSGAYRSLLEGIHNPNLAVKDGQIFSGAGPFGSVWGAHANHVHVALRALGALTGGAGSPGTIRAPRTGLTGLLGGIVQGGLNTATSAANQRVASLVGSMGGGDTTSQGATAQGADANVVGAFRSAISQTGATAKERLALWEAGIVESGLRNLPYGDADSLGSLQERTSIYGRAHALNPLASALRFLHQVIAKRPWAGSAGTLAQSAQGSAFPGRYDAVAGQARRYLAKGGFAKGGRPRVTKQTAQKPSGSYSPAAAKSYIKGLKPIQSDRIASYDQLLGQVDDLNTEYGLRDRRYSLSDEELVLDDGSVDEQAVGQRANELLHLILVRNAIIQKLELARDVINRIVKSYRTVIKRLKDSLKGASKKQRSGIRSQISDYQGRLTEWQGKQHDLLSDTLPSARLDADELMKERAGVLGTTADVSAALDSATPDVGTDAGSTDTTTDTTTAAPSAADIAGAGYADYQAFIGGQQNLLRSYAANFVSPFAAGGPGGVFSGNPSDLAAAGGANFLGAGGSTSLGGALGSANTVYVIHDGASVVSANYAGGPEDPGTHLSQMRYQLGAAGG